MAGCQESGTVSPRHFRRNVASSHDIHQNAHKFGQHYLLNTMPCRLGMSQRHKHGTGRNKNTTHKREIVACNNIGGRAGKASKVAPAEHNSRPDSQADSQASSSDFKVGASPPGTVMLYVIYTAK